MVIDQITFFKTPLSLNGEDRFFETRGNDRRINKEEYYSLLSICFEELVYSSTVKNKGINLAETFKLSIPLNFSKLKDFNYASIRVINSHVAFNTERFFYFIEIDRENNSMANTEVTFHFDYLAEYAYDIMRFSTRKVLKERSHISYMDYIDENEYKIKNSPRVISTFDKPTISRFISQETEENEFDVLWYDIQVTRFKTTVYSIVDGQVVPVEPVEFQLSNQNFSDGFASTYHLYRPYKIYKKGTDEEVTGVTAYYYKWLYAEETQTLIDTITNFDEIAFTDVPTNIVNISLTFNVPFEWTGYDDVLRINACGSTIWDLDDNVLAHSRHFIFYAPTKKEVDEFVIELDNSARVVVPNSPDTVLTDTEMVLNSPMLYLSNLNTFNLLFNSSIIPLYTEYYTEKIFVKIKIYPKDEGAFVKLIIEDSNGNTLYNSNNLPIIFNKLGEIPCTESQMLEYKIANSNRIPANFVSSIFNGTVAIGASLATNPTNYVSPVLSGAITAGYLLTDAIKTVATFADLSKLFNVSGQSAKNSMTDLIYQDRLIITKTVPIDYFSIGMVTFCKDYQEYGGVINREDEFLSLFNKLDSFMYIKTINLDLPLNTVFNEKISEIFNKGVRLWHLRNSEPIKTFNKMISNYER